MFSKRNIIIIFSTAIFLFAVVILMRPSLPDHSMPDGKHWERLEKLKDAGKSASQIVEESLLVGKRILQDRTETKREDTAEVCKFRVVGQDQTALSLVVSKGTSREQLKALITEFRNAKRGNYLDKMMIPATTNGGRAGDYGIVWILIFDEPEWATSDKLRKFMKSSAMSNADLNSDREYVKHIRAEYYYSAMDEYANLGFDDGTVRSPSYLKLF